MVLSSQVRFGVEAAVLALTLVVMIKSPKLHAEAHCPSTKQSLNEAKQSQNLVQLHATFIQAETEAGERNRSAPLVGFIHVPTNAITNSMETLIQVIKTLLICKSCILVRLSHFSISHPIDPTGKNSWVSTGLWFLFLA